MMTAIAMVAPLLNPPDELLLDPDALSAERVDEDDEEVEDKVDASEAVGVIV